MPALHTISLTRARRGNEARHAGGHRSAVRCSVLVRVHPGNQPQYRPEPFVCPRVAVELQPLGKVDLGRGDRRRVRAFGGILKRYEPDVPSVSQRWLMCAELGQ